MSKIVEPPVCQPVVATGTCQCGCGSSVVSKYVKGHQHRVPFDSLLDVETGCWEWQRSKFASGYGIVVKDGKFLGAHRVYYELEYGTIPAGMDVCHSCDNPSCVNPHHLFLGTARDNMQDAARKRRTARNCGEKHGCHKITKEEALNIILLSASRVSQRSISRKCGISQTQVNRIVNKKSWSYALSV